MAQLYSPEKNIIGIFNLTTKIQSLDVHTTDLTTNAIVIDCKCENNLYLNNICICSTITVKEFEYFEQVECLDFAKIILELTGGIISSKSLCDMYNYISLMLADENSYDFPSNWDFTFTNRHILIPRLLNTDSEINLVKGYCFFPDEFTFIKPLIIKFLCEKNPIIVF
ncbi:hypothetical protein ma55 [Moumouvirus australiensis]|uniref:Uncharacterized protein n=1 Tax=Moumouvirus australiensis TaxID=2109587 RepID=A0A2P1EKL7_9VIRU|nr:hypothetical protein QKC55_gp848 [Moumouvirus australiensis]AVL94442.1 hypothetical protein ma55 [Moumouvirus australiensis]